MADSLPIDVIFKEILPRLPPKSLIRFKSISKIFKTLISSPKFVNLHLQTSNRFLIFKGRFRGFFSFDLDSPESSAVNLPFPESFDDDSCDVFFVGSCNGLLCIGRYNSSLIIINPSTRIYRIIDHNFDGDTLYYGFGYDDANDDYKVIGINIDQQYDEDYDNVMCTDIVWVYSLKSNSWRLVDSRNSPGLISSTIAVLIDNHLLHWTYVSNQHQIRCFDLRNERWTDDIPLPETTNKLVLDLGVLNGSLCLLTQNQQFTAVVVWVMKEYGVKESWVKLLCIPGSIIFTCPLAYGNGSNSKEVLFGKFSNCSQSTLIWYNIGDKTSRQAYIYGIPLYSKVYASKVSLVAIPGGKQLSRKRRRPMSEDSDSRRGMLIPGSEGTNLRRGMLMISGSEDTESFLSRRGMLIIPGSEDHK